MSEEVNNEKKHTADKKKLKVALFCIGAVLVFYFGANFLKGLDAFGKKIYYYAVFDDVSGLNESTPLMIQGYKIGKIQRLKLIKGSNVKVCAEILVTESLDIPEDSKIIIASKDLLGGNVLTLVMGNSTKMAVSGDTLAASGLEGGLSLLMDKINDVLISVDTIALSLKDVLSPQNGGGNLKQSLAHIENVTANLDYLLAQNKGKVDNIFTNISTFSQTLKAASPQLENLVAHFDQIADTIAKANISHVISGLDSTIENIEKMIAKINQGEGTVGQLIQNKTLYNNIVTTTEDLNALLEDLKANPGRYVHISVFGKKEKKEKTK